MPQPKNPAAVPDQAIQALVKARRIVVFTGAGVSAESGIATFRGNPDSVWSKMSPSDMATPSAWRKNKSLVWAWYEARRGEVMRAQPNAGHLAIAQLAPTLQAVHGQTVQVDVVTQNVDNLHERGGIATVLHLHGSLFSPRCAECEQAGDFDTPEPQGVSMSVTPPTCRQCGGDIRPGVVWFGEGLPQDVWQEAELLVNNCDALIVVGTSGMVYPAARLPISASAQDKFTLEINPESSNLTSYMSAFFLQTAAVGLPALIDAFKAEQA